ncbi:hypothetical protein DV737_g4843, partial [Chaetothyriales sp. CBS 132003]
MEPDILSASSYPQELMSSYDSDCKRAKRKAAQGSKTKELPCGLVFRASSSSNSNENDLSSGEIELPTNHPNKRTKQSKPKEDDDNDGNGKKQRGRPRLNPRDETAADRAYRYRKETAIIALRQKVVDLKTTIENMNNAFLTLHDNLISDGIASTDNRLITQLQAASDQFIKLHKIVDQDDEEDETQKFSDTPVNETDSRLALLSSESKSQQTSQNTPHVTPQMTTSDETEFGELTATGPYEYVNVNEWLGMQQNSTQFNVQVPEIFVSMDQTSPTLTSFQAQLQSSVAKPLNPSTDFGFYTLSFQETTFARRLHRMTLEQAYRKLTNPEADPERIKRAFRFTFCLSNRRRMLYRIREILKRKAGESLENWNMPYFYIGGAGTHYPRQDNNGSTIYPPNMLPPEKAFGQQFGPRARVEVETPREGTTQEILDAIGFGGLWFDAHDVEQYLRGKGIYLDGHSSLVDVDPGVIHLTLPPLGQSLSGSRGSSTAEERTPSGTLTPSGVGNGGMESASDMYTLPQFDDVSRTDNSLMGTNTADGFDMSAQQVYNKQIWPWTDTPFFPFESDFGGDTDPVDIAAGPGHKVTGLETDSTRPQPLTFDVDKFLQRLTEGSACLGRAPGYRREMVDNALAMSLTDVF